MLNRTGMYGLAIIAAALATIGVLLLAENISRRKAEALLHVFPIVEITEQTYDAAVWGLNYPSQYQSYLRTVDIERTRFGGSEAFDKLEEYPRLKAMFAGYAFAIDYREERGHAYMLSDQRETLRVHQVQQPGACLHCHSSVLPAYRGQGRLAGVGDQEPWEQIMKGFEIVNAMPYWEATELVEHPVSCIDCHTPGSMELRITRPAFMNGIQAFARSDHVLPQFPSIERWRNGPRTTPYDPNHLASRQEMRSFVCAQCHVEYYFKGEEKYLTYPWPNGLKMEQAERYYDDLGFHDWYHEVTRAPLLKAQHPEFELTSSGIHARSGVACSDCHMPYRREGAVKISDHHVRSPLLNIPRACQTCHSYSEQEILERAEAIQVRTRALMDRAEIAVVDLIEAIREAMAAGATDAQLYQARQMHRKAHWRVDYVNAENSMGFHSPQESARILGEAIDYARQGQVEVARLGLSRR